MFHFYVQFSEMFTLSELVYVKLYYTVGYITVTLKYIWTSAHLAVK